MYILFIKLLIILILVFFSMLFSGSEIAIFSLESSGDFKDAENNDLYKKYMKLINIWNKSHLKIFNSILIGNNIILMMISVANTNVAFNVSSYLGITLRQALLILTICTTIIVITFGEIIPKIMGRVNPRKFFAFSAPFIMFFYKIIFPINFLISKFTFWTTDIVGLDIKNKGSKTTERDVEEFLSILESDGVIKKDEKQVIESIIDFGDIRANEAMLPRAKMDCIDVSIGFNKVIERAIELKHSRIPVYKDTLDNIIGILYVKDLFIAASNSDLFVLDDIIRPVYYIPLTKKINELLREFRKGHHHAAIVIDEYATVQGMVTIEDVLEEIVGDILDEYDKEEYSIEEIFKDRYLVDGDIELDVLSDKLDIEFEEEVLDEVRTLSGYILYILGRFPKKNEIIKTENLELTVKQIDKKIIKKVIVKL